MPKPRLEVPIARAQEVLRYEPETGKLYWKVKTADKVVVGREAGCHQGKRDVVVAIDGTTYQAHRLIWAIVTGEQPPNTIDHVDMNTYNNRWENLRAADESRNGGNRLAQKNNKSGTKGVYFYPVKLQKPWLARLQYRGVIRLNTYFATKEEAAAAYAEAASKWFGEFARTA